MKSNVIIRKAKEDDAAEILRVVKRVMSEVDYFPSTSEEFDFTVEQEEEFIKNIELFLIAEVDNKIVGTSTLIRGDYEKIRHTAMFGITILQEFTGLGIGSMMVKEVLNYSKENGIEKVDLEVFEDNLPGINLYKKFGFIVEGRKNKYIKVNGKYKDMILMTKLLRCDKCLYSYH